MSELVNFTRQGDIGVITINNPPVNALSPGVPEGIVAGIEAAEKDPEVQSHRADRRRPHLYRRRRHQGIRQSHLRREAALLAERGARKNREFDEARGHGDSRHRVRRRTGVGHGGPLSRRGRVRAGGAAGSEARDHSRRGRNAAPAAAGGRRESRRDVRVWRTDRREGRARGRDHRQDCRGRFARRARSSSHAESPGNSRCKTRERNEKLQRHARQYRDFRRSRASRPARPGAARLAPLAAIDAVEAATRLPLRRRHRARSRNFPRVPVLGAIESADPCVLRRTRGRENSGRSEGNQDLRHPARGRSSARAPWAAASR